MLSSLSLGLLGVVAAQINTAMDTLFARFASLEGPAYLNYAIHLQQLPLALFGIGIASALLPPLSRAFKSDHFAKYNELLEFALSLAMFIVIPCACAIFVLGGSSVNLLFGRGDFNHASTIHTTICLWGYGIGLIPMVITMLLAPAFYAKKNYIIPVTASLFAIFINFTLNSLIICVFHFGPESLAISTSIAAFFNAYILYRQLSKEALIRLQPSFMYSLAKTFFCSILSGMITLITGYFLLNDPTIPILIGKNAWFPRLFTEQAAHFGVLSIVFILTFVVSSLVFNRKAFLSLINFYRKPMPMHPHKGSSNNNF